MLNPTVVLRLKKLAQELTLRPKSEIPLDDFIVEVRVTNETPCQAMIRWKKYDACVASGCGDTIQLALEQLITDIVNKVADKRLGDR
jgi:hypothetical protein